MSITPVNNVNSTTLVKKNEAPKTTAPTNVEANTIQPVKSHKTAYYAIGGAALAVTMGVIFRKPIAKLFKSGESAAKDVKNLADDAASTANDGKNIAEGATSKTPKKTSAAEDLANKSDASSTDPQKVIATENKFDPTGKIKTSTLSFKDGTQKIIVSDVETNKTLKETKIRKDKTEKEVVDYNPTTGIKTKSTFYKKDGKTLHGIVDFDATTGQSLNEIFYKEDGKTMDFAFKNEYSTKTNKMIKETHYCEGKKYQIAEMDPESGHTIKVTQYYKNGKTIECIEEYTGEKVTKKVNYKADGKTIDHRYEVNPENEHNITTQYAKDGQTIVSIKEDYVKGEKYYTIEKDVKTQSPLKMTCTKVGSKTKEFTVDYNPTTGKPQKQICYNSEDRAFAVIYGEDFIQID